MDIQKNFAKDFSNLEAAVAYVADMQLHGSFSERRPDLGKMGTCPYCHTRRRGNGPRCCNPFYATTKRARDAEQGVHQMKCDERANLEVVGRAMIRKFKHKRHGQSREFKIRQQIVLFQANPELVKLAAEEMQVKKPDLAGLNPFVEKYIGWKEVQQARQARKQTKISRKINRGV